MSSNSQLVIGVTAIDNAKQVLQGVDQKVSETASKVDEASGRMVTRSSMVAQKFKENFGTIAVGAASLAAGMVSFATSFSTLEKAQSTANVANVTYERSLERLRKMQERGTATAAELANQQETVRVNAEKLALAQGNVSDVYANFLANVPLQFMSFATSATAIMKTLGYDIGRASAATSSSASSMGALSFATRQTTTATNQANTAMKLAFLTNPAGIAIMGVTTLVTLLVFNVGGLRDRVFELGAAIMNFLDLHFKPLADAIRWFIDNVAKPLGSFFSTEMPSSLDPSQQAFAETNVILGEGMPIAAGGAMTSLQNLDGKFATTGENVKHIFVGMLQQLEAADNKMRESIGLRDQVIASISRAPTAWGDTLGISDTISAVATRGAPSVTRAAPVTSREGVTNHINSILSGVPIRKNALGGEGIAYRPTLMLIGEAGPEHYKFTPGSRGQSSKRALQVDLMIGDHKIATAKIDDVDALFNSSQSTYHVKAKPGSLAHMV